MTEVCIITPPGMFGSVAGEDMLDTALRVIGVGFGDDGDWCAKYGCTFENETFLMHRYCWCENPDCPWCAGCYCEDNTLRGAEKKPPKGEKCDWCNDVHRWADKGALPPNVKPHYGAPHFWYKPSGFRLWWYKYIGRDMQTVGDLPSDFMQKIFASHPAGMTLEQAIQKTAAQEEATAQSFAQMFADLGIQ